MKYSKIIDLLSTLIVLLPIFCRGLPMLLDNKPFCQHKAFPIIPYRSQIWPNFRGTMCGTTRLSRHNWSPTYFTRLLARTLTADTRRGDPPGNLLNCHKDRLIDMRPPLLVCAYAYESQRLTVLHANHKIYWSRTKMTDCEFLLVFSVMMTDRTCDRLDGPKNSGYVTNKRLPGTKHHWS